MLFKVMDAHGKVLSLADPGQYVSGLFNMSYTTWSIVGWKEHTLKYP